MYPSLPITLIFWNTCWLKHNIKACSILFNSLPLFQLMRWDFDTSSNINYWTFYITEFIYFFFLLLGYWYGIKVDMLVPTLILLYLPIKSCQFLFFICGSTLCPSLEHFILPNRYSYTSDKKNRRRRYSYTSSLLRVGSLSALTTQSMKMLINLDMIFVGFEWLSSRGIWICWRLFPIWDDFMY